MTYEHPPADLIEGSRRRRNELSAEIEKSLKRRFGNNPVPERALRKTVKRAVDAYNDAPQEELGGLSPNQAKHQHRFQGWTPRRLDPKFAKEKSLLRVSIRYECLRMKHGNPAYPPNPMEDELFFEALKAAFS